MVVGSTHKYNLVACRKAADITYAAFRAIPQYIELGMTERQLAWRMGRVLEQFGSQKRAFPVIVAFGEGAAEPHHIPSAKRRLKKGDIIKLDAGAVFNNMRGDVTRTYFFGKPTQTFIKRYKAVYTAQQKAMPRFKAGNTGQYIDAAARDYLETQKLRTYFIHSLGHGVGRAIHQSPWITPTQRGTTAIEVGQVITNEPGIYIEGWGGIRIEDMVEITKRGPKLLGQASAKLQDIVIHR